MSYLSFLFLVYSAAVSSKSSVNIKIPQLSVQYGASPDDTIQSGYFNLYFLFHFPYLFSYVLSTTLQPSSYSRQNRHEIDFIYQSGRSSFHHKRTDIQTVSSSLICSHHSPPPSFQYFTSSNTHHISSSSSTSAAPSSAHRAIWLDPSDYNLFNESDDLNSKY